MIKIPPDLIKCVFPHPIKFHKINIFTSNPWWFEGKPYLCSSYNNDLVKYG